MAEDPPRPASLPPGFDEEDPYEDADLSSYPEWWRRNVAEFDAHGMRPYRPPRFADDALVPPLISELEAELGVDVRIRAVDPQDGGDWSLIVDGRRVATVTRRRESGGYTRYDLPSAEFESIVCGAVEGDPEP